MFNGILSFFNSQIALAKTLKLLSAYLLKNRREIVLRNISCGFFFALVSLFFSFVKVVPNEIRASCRSIPTGEQ